MLNIVIPMAGRGSRFRDAGYTVPKPLVEIHGRPMIEVVMNNLRPSRPHRFIFLCLAEHLRELGVRELLGRIAPGSLVVPVDAITQGAACTVLLAREYLANDQPLMIANSDQWVDCSIDAYLEAMDQEGTDGLIMTMPASDPKWSYVRLDAAGRITEVVEKKVVSKEATVGIYNFRRGSDYVEGAEAMIDRDLRVNGEFYVAPVYNELIARGAKLAYYNVGSAMHGLGIPADLDQFLADPASHRAACANAMGGR